MKADFTNKLPQDAKRWSGGQVEGKGKPKKAFQAA